jgi:hypothetical protein
MKAFHFLKLALALFIFKSFGTAEKNAKSLPFPRFDSLLIYLIPQATGRTIAYPIRLSVTFLRENGLNDEGLFRISPKQIKLDKVCLKGYNTIARNTISTI